MPVYEFICVNPPCKLAGKKQDQTIKDYKERDSTTCLICDGPVERQVSRTSFELKGSGWYISDYASK